MLPIRIAPSILSADRSNLQQEVRLIEPYADYIHIDIMDGKFVPPVTFRPEEIKAIHTKLPKDVHLMVEYPEKDGYIDSFIDAGAAIITIHTECKEDTHGLIRCIKKKGAVTIRPKTPIAELEPYLDTADMVLIMSVEPGYSGQAFMPAVLEKVRRIRKLKPELDIEIDGGINAVTIMDAVRAGANVIVAASAIFGRKDRIKAMQELRSAAKGALKNRRKR